MRRINSDQTFTVFCKMLLSTLPPVDDGGYCTYVPAGDAGWIHSEADVIQQVGRLVIRTSRD